MIRLRKNKQKPRRLITREDPKSPLAEAFRSLRTNIKFANVEKEIKSILVTSAGPGEGKSTVLANLAVAMAQAGQTVLVIDCDMRKPVQHKIFELHNGKGLTHFLLDKASLDEVIRPTAVENLSVLTTGTIPPNPSELLETKKFAALLEQLGEQYDRILVDSPPAGAVTDSVILSRIIDGVILAVYAEKTKVEQVKYVQEQMKKTGAKILGVVLTHTARKGRSYQYYHYYGEE
ncbi:MAG: CpsD/CapB family tyrosine-protein kinase [Bacillota bacterium]|nr:CpsD/CapB family tyrosine-protein kinase [Bacillota bacterium]